MLYTLSLYSKNPYKYGACCGAVCLVWFIENFKMGQEPPDNLCVFLKS
jgi:hypothetical protein